MDKNILLGKLTPFGNQKRLLVNEQQVKDIVSAMLEAHKKYASEYDKISDNFYSGNAVQTAKKIFEFLKKNIKYTVDSEASQKIMSPSAIISVGRNDCKNYALFIVGILDSLSRKGYFKNKVFYRFASYKLLDEIPHHTFAVVVDDQGNEVFVDPVLSSFNERKTYYHKIDKTPKMSLYSISGVFTKKPKPVATAKIDTTGITKAPAKKIVVKVALAPARGAFLLLVGLNFTGLATKLKQAFVNNKNKVNDFWNNLGGNTNELLRKVEQGALKNRLLGEDVYFPSEGQIGVVEAATAVTVTAATPILVKVAQFLTSLGIDAKELGESAKQILAKQVQNVVDKAQKKQKEEAQDFNRNVETIVESAETPATKTNYLPYLIGGGLVIYLISKKK
jgi:predicted transcriptional regulator